MLLLKYGDNMKKILISLCILFCITGCNKEKKLSYEIEDRTLNSDYYGTMQHARTDENNNLFILNVFDIANLYLPLALLVSIV